MASDVAALIRVRVLRRDGYRCQSRGCAARAAHVGVLGDGRYPVALCVSHVPTERV